MTAPFARKKIPSAAWLAAIIFATLGLFRRDCIAYDGTYSDSRTEFHQNTSASSAEGAARASAQIRDLIQNETQECVEHSALAVNRVRCQDWNRERRRDIFDILQSRNTCLANCGANPNRFTNGYADNKGQCQKSCFGRTTQAFLRYRDLHPKPPSTKNLFLQRSPANRSFLDEGDGGVAISAQKRESIYSREMFGVVKISIFDQIRNRVVSFGTGTFISLTGHLITNYHVLSELGKVRGLVPHFEFVDGTVTESYEVLRCDPSAEIDLCLIKLPLRPRFWFRLQTGPPPRDTPLYVIGNPRGQDFALRAGLRMSRGSTPVMGHQRMEVSIPVVPGFSGGPVFSEEGYLICIASNFSYKYRERDGKEEIIPGSSRHYCIDAATIRSYVDGARSL